ncbi:hypothetical protein H6G89_19480 [Oscillatoria sp. FACHB-1407]|uniref:hypothetical protein n=1 Tax=Oscillatoria sp. FACHB-1407 TaxID=2692847 RepID=UPI001686753A|nr:hypothetical protein [Oscillatoria sp. FACHB-1407]MBD2463219.1 hypothetical protein [Oscillatoria sp. FACHB-1407]
MQLQVQPLSAHRAGPAPCLILMSRDQYSSGRVQVPDLDRPIAAIQIGDRFYSFFKAVPDCRKLLGIIVKLSYRGDQIAITKASKVYGIWIWEPDAQSLKDLTRQGSTVSLPAPATCRILVSRQQYQQVDICVPDLDQPLQAIAIDNHYYSIFRVESDVQRLIELVGKITQRGDETIVTRVEKGYCICILEPEAQVITTSSH